VFGHRDEPLSLVFDLLRQILLAGYGLTGNTVLSYDPYGPARNFHGKP